MATEHEVIAPWVFDRLPSGEVEAIAHAMPQIVFIKDAAGRVRFVNDAFTNCTGLPAAAAHGEAFYEVIHPEDRDRLRAALAEGRANGVPVAIEYRLRCRNGTWRWYLSRSVAVRDEAGAVRYYVGTATDIDDTRRDAHRVRQQALLLDQAGEAIVALDLDGQVRSWNKGAERIFGWRAEEAIGRSALELLFRGSPEAIAASAQVAAAGSWQGRLSAWDREGRERRVEGRLTLVRDAEGRPESVIGITLDISGTEALERQVQQTRRLESIALLTGGVAHDFNNLLTVILGNADLLAERLEAEPRLRALAEMTRSAAQRAAALTQRLLAFARRQTLAPTAVDVDQRLEQMRSLLAKLLRADVVLDLRPGADGWRALVDEGQLEDAILSLCANAREALPNGGHVGIATRAVHVGAGDGGQHPQVPPGEYVQVSVSDDGIGIAPEHQDRVFDPFFTTKQGGVGAGLGLSMVHGFVTQSGGQVRLESAPGRGTTVMLYLPRARTERRASATPADGAREVARARILMAEDDDLVRAFVQRQLSSLGHEVWAVANGAEALAILAGPEPIDLLFTDVVMPGGLNGRELATEARRLRPALRVLFTSGYTDDVFSGEHGLPDGMQILLKPYAREDLARAIDTALSAEPSAEAR